MYKSRTKEDMGAKFCINSAFILSLRIPKMIEIGYG